jgi:hypothetical protein
MARTAGQPAATRVFDHGLGQYRPILAGEPGAPKAARAPLPSIAGTDMALPVDSLRGGALDAVIDGLSRAATALRSESVTRPLARTPEFERAVRERAYFCWLECGQPHGREQEHWAQAERDILAHSSLPH